MEFSPEDRAWIDSNPISFGSKELGSGAVGRVYELDNNPELCIKVPRKFIPQSDFEVNYWPIDHRTETARAYLQKEIENYNNIKDLEIITPTQVVKLGIKTASGEEYLGLVRPKLKASNSDLKTLSDKQLFDLRENFINLSEAGYRIRGFLQVGISKSGEAQIYDMGIESMRFDANKQNVFEHNNITWRTFLYQIGKNYWDYAGIKPR